MLLLAGCGSDSDSDSESAGDEVSLLFVQDADGGTLDDDQLTMIEVSPNTGWFTDRPVREAGQMATADFVSLWGEGAAFDTDPPNADFTCQVDGDTVNVVVELSSPFAAINGDTLTYNVKRVGDTPAGDFDCDGNAHLFIDSVSDQCWKATELRNLQGVDLSGCNLTSTSTGFYGQNLSGANLSGANLTGMTLNRSDLSGANLSGANLHKADLAHANLTGANLTGANLSETMIEDANLSDANLSDANLYWADLIGADLSNVTGWDTAKGKGTIRGLDKAKNVPD